MSLTKSQNVTGFGENYNIKALTKSHYHRDFKVAESETLEEDGSVNWVD